MVGFILHEINKVIRGELNGRNAGNTLWEV
jgi:hypothetical protein